MQNGILKVITPPPVEPITLALAKAHCRVDIDNDDTILASYIKAARAHAEGYMRRFIVQQTVELRLDAFPHYSGCIVLPGGEVQSVEWIKYFDSDGAEQTWPSTEYLLDSFSVPARLEAASGYTFPSAGARNNAVGVRYQVGYAPGAGSPTDYTENVPADIQHALLLLVGHFYENRESVVIGTIVSEVPQAVDSLLYPHRICT